MKKMFAYLANVFLRQGVLVTPEHVQETFRSEFDVRILPMLGPMGWPVPETDEGRSVCVDLFGNYTFR